MFPLPESWFISSFFSKLEVVFQRIIFLGWSIFSIGVWPDNIYPRVSLNCLILAQGYVSFSVFASKTFFENKAKMFWRILWYYFLSVWDSSMFDPLLPRLFACSKLKTKEKQTSVITLEFLLLLWNLLCCHQWTYCLINLKNTGYSNRIYTN